MFNIIVKMAKFRGFKKVVRRVARSAKRRYFKGKGYSKPNLSRMVKDLSIVKSMVNAEKEIYTAHSTTSQNVDFDTPYFEPITNVAGGTSHGERDGESVKLHGYRWALRFAQQNSTTNPIYAKMWLVKYIGPRGSTPSVSTFLKPDFDGLYTAYSDRNEDHYQSYSIICSTGLVKIPCDQVSGQTQFAMRKLYGRFKGKTHQRYSGTSATSLLTDQMYILCVTSGGDTASSTALKFDSQMYISFYDN